MNKYSKSSRKQLASCDRRLQEVFNEVLLEVDHTILEGHRGKASQNAAFRLGKSKLKWPNGDHNQKPSKALDATPYPIDWEDKARHFFFAGYVLGVAEMMGIKIRWGGDWDSDKDFEDQTFNDLVHFEIIDD